MVEKLGFETITIINNISMGRGGVGHFLHFLCQQQGQCGFLVGTFEAFVSRLVRQNWRDTKMDEAETIEASLSCDPLTEFEC